MDKQRKLDRTDCRILEILQRDGRISNVELATLVNLSASACLQRVRKLEARGLITGYHARINLNEIHPTVSVLALVTLHHDKENFSGFEEIVQQIPDIVECLKVSGEFDYQLRFECRDMERYHDLSETLLNKAKGITNLSSHIILHETKNDQGRGFERLPG